MIIIVLSIEKKSMNKIFMNAQFFKYKILMLIVTSPNDFKIATLFSIHQY